MSTNGNMMTLDQMMEDEAVQRAGEIAAEEEMSEEEAMAEQDAIREARRAAMNAIGVTMSQRLAQAVQFRSTIENEWNADQRQFETGDAFGNEAATNKQYSGVEEDYKSANDNITRPAVLTYASRLGDMLFPTNDRNWDVDPTPKPDLPDEVLAEIDARIAENGLPPEERQNLILEIANKRMDLMRRTMDDQLSEAQYNSKGREAILDACRIGVGIVRGPFAKTRKRRRYSAKQGFKASIVEDMTSPEVDRVDPWRVFPMPCRRIEDCPGVFELHEMSAKRLAELRHQPGFSAEQVGRALRSPPSWAGFSLSMMGQRREGELNILRSDELYPVVSYDGEMPKDALLIFLDQLLAESKIDDEARSEIVEEVNESNALHVNCNVWMVGGTVIKCAISPIDHCSQMYKFFTIEDREDGPWGRSLPALLRDDQRSVRMLWAAILLNSMMSAGVQIAVKRGALVPAGANAQKADLRFTQPRVWAFSDDVEDVGKAMQAFQVPNTVAALLPVYERAKKNAEEHVMLPLIAQGEPTQAVPTSSGLAMLMNAANIVQRRIAKRWDDSITTPIISDLYEWNMRYGPDEAKGDYKVRARASSHLLVKDIQAQNLFTALQLFQNTPMLAKRMNEEKWAEAILRVMDADISSLLLSQAEVDAREAEAAKNAPADPNVVKAEAANKIADARVASAQADAQFKQARLQQQDADSQRRFEAGIADRESAERRAAMQVQAALAGLDKEAQLRIMQMQQDMQEAIQSESEETRREGMRIAAKAEDKRLEMKRDQFEASVEANTSPGPRLA